MAEKNPRINITIDAEEAKILALLAKKRGKSVAGVAKELIFEALELQEDLGLARLSDARIEAAKKKKQQLISHDDVWK